jgi:hypothetical protein
MRVAQAAWVISAALIGSWAACTAHDINDQIEVVETVPAPDAAATPHRISRALGAGSQANRVDRGQFTSAVIRVLSPSDEDLFPFLRVSIYVRTSAGRTLLAEGTDFHQGERERDLEIQYTDDIKPFLTAEDLTVEWDIYYKTSEAASYPAAGIQLETVIGVNLDVRIL